MQQGKRNRVPAQEIESLVTAKVRSFLSSPHAVLDALASRVEKHSATRTLLTGAKRQLAFLKSASPDAARRFLRSAISKVVIGDSHVQIFINKAMLRDVLISGNWKAGTITAAEQNSGVSSQSLLKLEVTVEFKRSRGESRLVVPPDAQGNVPNGSSRCLVKAVARGRAWYVGLLHGEVTGRRSIAKGSDLDERYVARILSCAFLAPDIVEAILNGRQPPDLTMEKLRRPLPCDWEAQRIRIGFAGKAPFMNARRRKNAAQRCRFD